MNFSFETRRTNPDFVAYVPKAKNLAEALRRYREQDTGFDTEGGKSKKLPVDDTGNEHFLVEHLPKGGLFAVWTQSSFEGASDQRIVFSKCQDGGHTWSEPVTIAGPDIPTGSGMASWAFPFVSRSGRIYVVYSRHVGINEIGTHTTGLMACICTDDEGKNWSSEAILSMPRSIWDNPDPAIPANWIVWQKPLRLSDGKHLTGFTRWVSPKNYTASSLPIWWAQAAVVEFMRFENVDEDPAPERLEITYLAGNENALRAGLVGNPHIPDIQEPSWWELPDKRLFCVMRTTLGSPHYAISEDRGVTWSRPAPLRQFDDGPVLPHPCSPCPIYTLNSTNFIFLYHNHDGHFLNYTPFDTAGHRRPICLARAEFRPQARQPLWFSEPWFFMDNGGVPILRSDLAMYSSVTRDEQSLVLWYPERKFFLLGKRMPDEFVLSLKVPPWLATGT